jgi:hypothetical protein
MREQRIQRVEKILCQNLSQWATETGAHDATVMGTERGPVMATNQGLMMLSKQ